MIRKYKIWMKGEVALWQCCYLPLAVADNIRSSLSCYTTLHRILNRKFCFNYIVLAACDITEGLDNCVASKWWKRC